MSVKKLWRRTVTPIVLPFLLLSTVTYLFWAEPSHSVSVDLPTSLDPVFPNITHQGEPTIVFLKTASTVPQDISPSSSQHTQDALNYPSPAPGITIIALWSTRDTERAIYLNNFYASVKANPSIDLLLIKFDKYGTGMNCEMPQSTGVPNVREVCLTVDEYWELHGDFLCKRWGCDTGDKAKVMQTLKARSGGDFVNSYFRPFRAAIFNKWVNPETKIWGWCDLDIMLGNFDRAFPWDVAEDYDLIVPGGPINGDDVLLYLPGHLMFFKHAKSVVDEFMNFPNLKTMHAFLNLPWIGHDAEESEYSHFAFTNPRITFLRFDAMVTTTYHISSPDTGIYNIGNDFQWDLWTKKPWPTTAESRTVITAVVRNYVHDWKRQPTFSKEGTEYEVKLREGEWPLSVWFPKKYAVDFVTDHERFQFRGRRYVYRQVPDGLIFDRQEEDKVPLFLPPTPSDAFKNRHSRPFLQEMLYNHFQVEKYQDWWALPDETLKPNELLLVDKFNGAQMWDFDGNVHFETSPKSE